MVLGFYRPINQDSFENECEHVRVGSVSKVEIVTPMGLIYKVLLPSISTFETPPAWETLLRGDGDAVIGGERVAPLRL